MAKRTLQVEGTEIAVFKENNQDYISLTDMLKGKDGDFHIADWLRNRNTLEFIKVWEELNNPNFNYGEFAIIENQSGLNGFKVSVKELTEKCGIIGIKSTAGRYGGTYAHQDIAFEFGMWISPKFKLYLIRDYQRLKEEEHSKLNAQWDLSRFLSKINYKIHTIEQLIVLSNIEAMNAEMIKQGLGTHDRIIRLNEIAIYQIISLSKVSNFKKLKQ